MISFEAQAASQDWRDLLEDLPLRPIYLPSPKNPDDTSPEFKQHLPEFVGHVVIHLAGGSISNFCYYLVDTDQGRGLHFDNVLESEGLSAMQQEENLRVMFWTGGGDRTHPIWVSLRIHPVDSVAGGRVNNLPNLMCTDIEYGKGTVPISELYGTAWLVYPVRNSHIMALRLRLL